jgi:hypothetical protein
MAMKAKLLLGVLLVAALSACTAGRDYQTSTVARQNLNSSLVDCNSLTPEERAQLTPRSNCVEVFRPDETGSQ